MPEPGLPHPEFAMSVDAMVAEAVLATLRADPALRTFMQSIEVYELEDLLITSSAATPALAVILDATAESRSGGNRQVELTTVLVLGYITDTADREGTQQWLRARIGDHLKRVLTAQEAGVLHWQGQRVTEALVTFRRLTSAVQLGTGAHLLTRFVVEFTSDVNEATREFIE